MLIMERILKLTEEEPQSGEFREYIIKAISSDEYLPAIARSVHFEKYLYLVEKEFKWKYNTSERKKTIKKFFKYLLNFEITPKERFDYILNQNSKSKDN
jgi:hypothetical protein